MSKDSDKLLRDIIEKELKPSCGVYKETISNKIRNFRLRKFLGRKILGKPRYDQGIRMTVDLSYKTKDEVDSFWKALECLQRAGINFDHGCGDRFYMHFDWSLKGAVVYCRGCGFKSEEYTEQIKIANEKEHRILICDRCKEIFDSKIGHYELKKHFWNKTRKYHTECYQEEFEK